MLSAKLNIPAKLRQSSVTLGPQAPVAERPCAPACIDGRRAMAPDAQSTHSPLVTKLETIMNLTDEERQTLAEMPMHVRDLREDQDIVREGDRPSQSCLLIEGFAYRYQALGDG